MLSARTFRGASGRLLCFNSRRYSTHLKVAAANEASPHPQAPTVSKSNETPTSAMGSQDQALVESVDQAEQMRQMQAPNRKAVWSPNQQPRNMAMVGPRFEQIIIKDQPQPYSAIELIHKQPVRWRKERIASCDGGGGPLGHPRIFINLDKPQICWCTYCGLPFANEHHREHIESLPSTSYPLGLEHNSAVVEERQAITDNPLEQR